MKKTILTMLGALALFGCGGGGGNGGGGSSPSARVAYVNASPDASSLDFLRNGSTTATAVPYGTATAFGATDDGEGDFSTRATGESELLWSETFAPEASSSALVLAVGLRTPPTDDSVPPVPETEKRLVLSFGAVDRTAPSSGHARLIVANALVRQGGFPTPAIDFRSPDTIPDVSVTNVAFGELSPQDVDSGVQTVEVRQTGTNQTFVASTDLTLEAGKVYLALVSGYEGTTGATAPTIRLIAL